ncbi:MAG: hypothetical protein ACT4N8_07270 [Sphingosinicella sp.]|uniref:hypothetical protein n=1 Tax=Sphingosinicella sp. TaxID=1917971 RepID=UPI0040380D7E
MNPNAVAEALAVLSTIDPGTITSTPKVGDWVAVKNYHKLIAIFLLGDIVAETIDAAVQEAQSGSGTGAQAFKAATQLAAHATNNDNVQIVIEIDVSKISAGFTHVAPRLVTGGITGGPAAAVILGVVNRFDPASDSDLASVVEIARK